MVIRTNGGTLTINAENDTVKHYGSAKVVTLTAVSSSSYYEHGVANLVDIKNGRLVITNDSSAEVGTIYLTATNNEYNGIILATQNGSELPEVVARESVDLPTGEAKKLVVTIQTNVNAEGQNPTKTEEIYLYPASDVKEETNGYNVSDLGMLVVEAISSDAQTQAAEQITNTEVLEAVKEAKTSELEAVAEKATLFAGGKGTVEKPYLISDVNELEDFRDAWNAGLLSEGTYFALSRDIDMTGRVWTPIGNASEKAFSGYFDGRKHKISNLTSTNYSGPELVLSSSGTSGSGLGLFGWGIGNIEVKDLDIEVRFNEQSSYVGGILGVYISANDNEETFNVTFKNITVDGSMVAKDKMGAIVGSTYASSYFGTNKNITIEFNNCTNSATICGIDTSARIGGIAGTVSGQFAKDETAKNNEVKVLFIKCTNNSEAITSTSTTYKVGGIVGFLANPGNYTFTNCTSVEMGDGGNLFGRFHGATTQAWGGQDKYSDYLSIEINQFGSDGFYNYYNDSMKRIYVYASSVKDVGLFTYTAGISLAEDEWRLTIDGKHYKCGIEVPVDGIEDCTEITSHPSGNAFITEEGVWNSSTHDLIETTVNTGYGFYIQEKSE